MELWKDIKGYEGKYKISSYGRVLSVYKSKHGKSPYLKPFHDSKGYCQVELSSKAFSVHRLVATHFLERPSQYQLDEAQKTKNKKVLVNHKDGDKDNNHVDNLEWCTYKENSKHSYDIGLQIPRSGEDNNSKFTEIDVFEIRNKYNNTIQTFIINMASEYDMSIDSIEDIVYNKTWKHLL